jgi:hypothetical protein
MKANPVNCVVGERRGQESKQHKANKIISKYCSGLGALWCVRAPRESGISAAQWKSLRKE